MLKCDFYRDWYLSSNRTLQMLYGVLGDLDLNFQGHNFEANSISETVKASTKKHRMTFVDVDIHHRMTSLWMLFSVTLIFIFKVKHYLIVQCYTKLCMQQMSMADLLRLVWPPQWSCSCFFNLSMCKFVSSTRYLDLYSVHIRSKTIGFT